MGEEVRARDGTVYTSESAWPQAIDHTLAIYCSDPWFRKATAEFLESLGLTQYDQVVMPGGPSVILQSSFTFISDRQRVKLLCEIHEIRRVVAVAHLNCAYYRHRFGLQDVGETRKKQHADLMQFEVEMLRISPGLSVELYYADVAGDRFQFTRVGTPRAGGEVR